MGLGFRRGGSRLARLASWMLLALVALVWLGPYLWMVSTSLKTLPEIVAAPAYPLPSGLELGGYREAPGSSADRDDVLDPGAAQERQEEQADGSIAQNQGAAAVLEA